MSVCCCPGTGGGTDCCCQTAADNYLVTFSGISDSVGAGTGSGTGDAAFGCFLLNTSFCLCYLSCGLYAGDEDPLEATFEGNCLRDYNTFRITLEFDCTASATGTGSGTGTAPYAGAIVLTIRGYCQVGNNETVLATYMKARDSWHCENDANVMSLSYTNGECLGWPATVSVTKNALSLVCSCTCGGSLVGVGQTLTYEFRMGALAANGNCLANSTGSEECGCDAIYTRICLSQLGNCDWLGYWYSVEYASYYPYANAFPQPIAQTPFIDAYLAASGDYPSGCTPASPTRALYLHYDRPTDTLELGWVTNTPTEATLSIFDDPVTWSVKYTLAASLFSVFGNNTFSYAGGTYDSCTVPSTVEVNFYSYAGCGYDYAFACDICGGSSHSPGWTFTIAGVAGDPVTHSIVYGGGLGTYPGTLIPCESFNGTYCLGAGQYASPRCQWGTGYGSTGGYAPDARYFSGVNGTGPTTYVAAEMRIDGGVVAIRLLVDNGYGFCLAGYEYQISVEDFVCDASNILTKKCSGETNWPTGISDQSGCDCTGMPATITITPTTACGAVPSSSCACLPKASYSPRAVIAGRIDGSCEGCSCIPDLDMCFTASGASTECTWRCDFTMDLDTLDVPFSCDKNATYALLDIGQTDPTLITLTIYNASNVALVTYGRPLSAFSCSDTAFTLFHISESDVCDWSGATCTLNMHGATPCNDCNPCGDLAAGLYMYVSFQYNGASYGGCFNQSGCRAYTGNLKIFGETFLLYAIVEFGPDPMSFSRILIYINYAGTGTADTLIGVYNFASPISSYGCANEDDNTHTLATGNAGQCGNDVDVTGYTSKLGAYAIVGVRDTLCPTCDGAYMPHTVIATFTDGTGLCCTSGEATTLVYDPITNEWTGTISCSSGEVINLTFKQGGTDCTNLLLDAVFVNGCTSDVSNEPPYSCSCGDVTFVVAGGTPPLADTIRVTW